MTNCTHNCERGAGNKEGSWEEMSATAKLNQAELLRRKAAEAIAAQAALMEARGGSAALRDTVGCASLALTPHAAVPPRS